MFINMNADFHPARMRSAAGALVDAMIALSVIAILMVSVMSLFNNGSRDELARAYARQFGIAQEDACPAQLGKAFWFSCASEVRRNIPIKTGPIAPQASRQPSG